MANDNSKNKRCDRCDRYFRNNRFIGKFSPDPITSVVFINKNQQPDRSFTLCDSCLFDFMQFIKSPNKKVALKPENQI